jgi:serine/threonine protein kinase
MSAPQPPGNQSSSWGEPPTKPPKPDLAGESDLPASLGRYRLTARLGHGGFGVVYQAYDEQLRREVALKVPHRDRLRRPEDAEAYLAEAQILARLDHPHIVPVYDVGQSDGLYYVVSKFIAGSDLAQQIRAGRLSHGQAVELVATVAEALHHAHTRGLVHRDIKPGNILIDKGGRVYIGDFGLALQEEDHGRGGSLLCGTPAYMSPEQASGEGHRVDGRSDIFSLGVVFYELLTGRRPFRGETPAEVLKQIVSAEPRPPRQIDDAIPRELERICLKALSRRARERYATAKDMADDLRQFLRQSTEEEKAVLRSAVGARSGDRAPAAPAAPTPSDRPLVRVVPKGLRAFDAQDADFFLELLPGPRDREGLPDSIRF